MDTEKKARPLRLVISYASQNQDATGGLCYQNLHYQKPLTTKNLRPLLQLKTIDVDVDLSFLRRQEGSQWLHVGVWDPTMLTFLKISA